MLQGIPPGTRRALQPIVYVAGHVAVLAVSVLAFILGRLIGPDTTET